MARQKDCHVMLSTFAPLSVNSAMHLVGQGERPFAAAQGDNQGSSVRDHVVMLSVAKYLTASLPIATDPSLRSELALNEVKG